MYVQMYMCVYLSFMLQFLFLFTLFSVSMEFSVVFKTICCWMIWILSEILKLFCILCFWVWSSEWSLQDEFVFINTECLQGISGTCQGSYLHLKGSMPHCYCRQQSLQLFIATGKWNSMHSIFCWASTWHAGAQIFAIKN